MCTPGLLIYYYLPVYPFLLAGSHVTNIVISDACYCYRLLISGSLNRFQHSSFTAAVGRALGDKIHPGHQKITKFKIFKPLVSRSHSNISTVFILNKHWLAYVTEVSAMVSGSEPETSVLEVILKFAMVNFPQTDENSFTSKAILLTE